MSKLGCQCGATIRDNTDSLPYKAELLKDIDRNDFFDWITEEIQSYLDAALNGEVAKWVLEKGYGSGYADLNLSHGHLLHDHIHTKFIMTKRDMYQCDSCGRIHIEKTENNRFASFVPDSDESRQILTKSPTLPFIEKIKRLI